MENVLHYCVTNMPGAVGRTSTYALCNVTLPWALQIARRGIHLSREYSVDPLEVLFVGDVMGDARPVEVDVTNGVPGNGAPPKPGGGPDAPIVFADDTLRHVAYVMAESGRTELPVAERARPEDPIGTVRLEQLLKGRLRDLDEERHRTRVLRPLAPEDLTPERLTDDLCALQDFRPAPAALDLDGRETSACIVAQLVGTPALVEVAS